MLRTSCRAMATLSNFNISCKKTTQGLVKFRAFGTSNFGNLNRLPSITFLVDPSQRLQRQHRLQRLLNFKSFFSTTSCNNNNRIYDVQADSLVLVDTSENKNKDDGGNGNLETKNKNPTFETGKSSKFFLRFTCKVCDGSNSHMISKQAYYEGVVIVTCPSCSNHHLIADNLNWFEDIKEKNIEEIMKSKGETVIKVLSSDVKEFLPDS